MSFKLLKYKVKYYNQHLYQKTCLKVAWQACFNIFSTNENYSSICNRKIPIHIFVLTLMRERIY